MYPRTNYEMTEDDLKELLKACQPTRVMLIGGYNPPSPQENANRAWQKLGEKYGFDYQTVRPISGKGQRFFTAIPSENEAQKEERLKREAIEKNLSEIKEIESKIEELQNRLKVIREK
jgi:uncharacterized Fe-S cluster-containing radical SAM superfamily protein